MDNVTSNRLPNLHGGRVPVRPAPLDRQMPHSAEAEAGVIGCCLLDPVASVDMCVERFHSMKVFYDLRFQEIFDAMVQMREKNQPIDMVTVVTKLRRLNKLEACGGVALLGWVQEQVPSAANLSYYTDLLIEKYTRRKLIQTCTNAIAKTYDHDGETAELLATVERDVLSIRDDVKTGKAERTTWEVILELKKKYELAKKGKPQIGIPTGFHDLDKMVGGMGDQELILLAGSPSAGKTSLAVNIANHVLDQGYGVGIFSLETSDIKVIHRMACARCNVNGKLFFEGHTDLDLQMKMDGALVDLQRLSDKLMICEQGGLTVPEMLAKGRRWMAAGVRLVIVDYMQLLAATGKDDTEKNTSRSQGCKLLAKQMNCPVIAISSLTKEGTNNARPKMGDLRYGGQAQYDADHIWLLHCAKPEEEVRTVTLNVAKGKESSIGDIELRLYKTAFMFKDAAIAPE